MGPVLEKLKLKKIIRQILWPFGTLHDNVFRLAGLLTIGVSTLVACVLIYQAIFIHSIIISRVSVPKALADDGYPSARLEDSVVAQLNAFFTDVGDLVAPPSYYLDRFGVYHAHNLTYSRLTREDDSACIADANVADMAAKSMILSTLRHDHFRGGAELDRDWGVLAWPAKLIRVVLDYVFPQEKIYVSVMNDHAPYKIRILRVDGGRARHITLHALKESAVSRTIRDGILFLAEPKAYIATFYPRDHELAGKALQSMDLATLSARQRAALGYLVAVGYYRFSDPAELQDAREIGDQFLQGGTIDAATPSWLRTVIELRELYSVTDTIADAVGYQRKKFRDTQHESGEKTSPPPSEAEAAPPLTDGANRTRAQEFVPGLSTGPASAGGVSTRSASLKKVYHRRNFLIADIIRRIHHSKPEMVGWRAAAYGSLAEYFLAYYGLEPAYQAGFDNSVRAYFHTAGVTPYSYKVYINLLADNDAWPLISRQLEGGAGIALERGSVPLSDEAAIIAAKHFPIGLIAGYQELIAGNFLFAAYVFELPHHASHIDACTSMAVADSAYTLAKENPSKASRYYRFSSIAYEWAYDSGVRGFHLFNNWGSTLSGVGDETAAIEKYNKALGYDGSRAWAYLNKANSLNHLGRYRSAEVAAKLSLHTTKTLAGIGSLIDSLYARKKFTEVIDTYWAYSKQITRAEGERGRLITHIGAQIAYSLCKDGEVQQGKTLAKNTGYPPARLAAFGKMCMGANGASSAIARRSSR